VLVVVSWRLMNLLGRMKLTNATEFKKKMFSLDLIKQFNSKNWLQKLTMPEKEVLSDHQRELLENIREFNRLLGRQVNLLLKTITLQYLPKFTKRIGHKSEISEKALI